MISYPDVPQPIFVRPLTLAERQELEAGLRSSSAFVLRRCQALLASASGERVPQIARALGGDEHWLNAIEPKWVHGKRRVVEAERLLTAWELIERVCAAYGCRHEPHLSLPEKLS